MQFTVVVKNLNCFFPVPAFNHHITISHTRTVWEIKQRIMVDMAADRGCYIDQSQSLNIHMDQPNFGKLTSLHFYAWSKVQKPVFSFYPFFLLFCVCWCLVVPKFEIYLRCLLCNKHPCVAS